MQTVSPAGEQPVGRDAKGTGNPTPCLAGACEAQTVFIQGIFIFFTPCPVLPFDTESTYRQVTKGRQQAGLPVFTATASKLESTKSRVFPVCISLRNLRIESPFLGTPKSPDDFCRAIKKQGIPCRLNGYFVFAGKTKARTMGTDRNHYGLFCPYPVDFCRTDHKGTFCRHQQNVVTRMVDTFGKNNYFTSDNKHYVKSFDHILNTI